MRPVGVAVGGFLTYLAAVRIETLRRRADEKRERRQALAEYLGRLTIAFSILGEYPQELPPSPFARVRKATLEKSAWVRSRDWMKTQKALREYLGENLWEPLYQLIESYSRLRLLSLDARVWEQVEASFDYVGVLGRDRSEDTLREWPDVRRRLLEAIEASGDAIAIEAAEHAVAAVGSDLDQIPRPRD